MSGSRTKRQQEPRWPTRSEAEALARVGAPVIGIGGSSGKTVTLRLLRSLLEHRGTRVVAGLDNAMDRAGRATRHDWVLLELPASVPHDPPGALDVLILTGMAADELPPGTDLPAATAVLSQAVAETRRALVLNADDARLLALASSAAVPVHTASVNGARSGARLADGHLQLRCDGAEHRVVAISRTNYAHPPLTSDMLVAAAAAALLGTDPDVVRSVLLAHRPPAGCHEALGSARGVLWVDDGRATRPGRAAAALAGHGEPVVVVAGGRDEGQSFARWARAAAASASSALLFGSAAEPMARTLHAMGLTDRIVRCSDLEDAVSIASRVAERGDTVLYSPGAPPEVSPGAPAFRDLAPLAERRREAA